MMDLLRILIVMPIPSALRGRIMLSGKTIAYPAETSIRGSFALKPFAMVDRNCLLIIFEGKSTI